MSTGLFKNVNHMFTNHIVFSWIEPRDFWYRWSIKDAVFLKPGEAEKSSDIELWKDVDQ